VRECAKLQGFPDWFEFCGVVNMSEAYRMIGNAVPPPMARIWAESLKFSSTYWNEIHLRGVREYDKWMEDLRRLKREYDARVHEGG
jgi:DNA (cytosine-5)-methyltransferase 1